MTGTSRFRRLRIRVARTLAALRALPHRRNLSRLAAIYRTDKLGHGYMPLYQRHFRPFRDQPVTLLEIGIGGYADPLSGGASLRLWAAYFRKGRIFGLDIEDKRPQATRRITIHKGNQSDPATLKALIKATGPLDIVIDDASHVCRDVIASFEVLFPVLKPGGIYVVEDTQTSYWTQCGGSMDSADSRTTMNYFKALADGLNHAEYPVADRDPSYLDQTVVAIHFYHNIIVVEKGENTRPSNVSLEHRLAAARDG
ncbi:class I SAM-dependent methyltransferase [Pseudooceanicola sp.]|uniref:class I SAM-dependent methyltransferase n=1 Tax=Pseudooceanicola sp. TaxID=1914328 RepID=UPI0035C6AF37